MSITSIAPDIARDIARLDRHAALGANDKTIEEPAGWTLLDLRKAVAASLAYALGKYSHGYGLHVTAREVRFMMIAGGASYFTIQQHSRAIASLIRSDYLEGWKF